jgi:hypothetical protein
MTHPPQGHLHCAAGLAEAALSTHPGTTRAGRAWQLSLSSVCELERDPIRKSRTFFLSLCWHKLLLLQWFKWHRHKHPSLWLFYNCETKTCKLNTNNYNSNKRHTNILCDGLWNQVALIEFGTECGSDSSGGDGFSPSCARNMNRADELHILTSMESNDRPAPQGPLLLIIRCFIDLLQAGNLCLSLWRYTERCLNFLFPNY